MTFKSEIVHLVGYGPEHTPQAFLVCSVECRCPAGVDQVQGEVTLLVLIGSFVLQEDDDIHFGTQLQNKGN